jgi:hypothetical protein
MGKKARSKKLKRIENLLVTEEIQTYGHHGIELLVIQSQSLMIKDYIYYGSDGRQ